MDYNGYCYKNSLDTTCMKEGYCHKMKKLMSLLIAGAMLLATTACTGSGPSEANSPAANTPATSSEGATPADPAASGDKIKLTAVFRDDGRGEDSPNWRWLLSALDTYENKDQIELNVAPITASEGDYFAKIALSLQSQATAPNLVFEDTFQLPTDAAAGYLAPLDEYLGDYADWNNGSYYDSLKIGVTGSDGKIYGLPYNTDTRGLWYNKEIFKQAGLPEDWAPKNWQEILDACETIKQNVPDVVPFWCNSAIATGEATSMQTYEMLLYGTGDRLIEDGKWVVSSPNILKSLQFLDSIYKGGYGPSLSLVLNGQASNTSAREYLPQGKLAISLDGSWISGNYLDTGASPWPEYGETLGFAPMPTSEGQTPSTITLAGGWSLSIPAKSSNHKESFDFAAHMMKLENYAPIVIQMGSIATRTDIIENAEYSGRPFVATATDFLVSADFRPKDDKYPVISTHIQTMVEAVVSGTSPEDAMAQYAMDVTSAVGADNVINK